MTLTVDAPACPDTALLPVVGGDTPVPLVDGRSVPYANLDYAASAPALVAVAQRVAEVLPLYASVHRGAGYLSQVSTALYESSRRVIGSFVGARPDDVTILTRNTTDSMALLASVVPAGPGGRPGRVLLVDVEHHANLLPWTRGDAAGDAGRQAAAAGGAPGRSRATVLRAEPSVVGTLRALRDELAAGHREGDPYLLVAVTGASNVTGESLPLEEVLATAHDASARVVVDGAQLVPHRGVSLRTSDVDYIAFSGHKTYAPYGAGALVGRRDWLDAGSPYLAGGGAVRDVTPARTVWNSAPARHEAGSPNVIGAIALAEACERLAALPAGALDRHERSLRARLVDGLAALPGVRVLRIWQDSHDPVGVVSFTVAGHDPGLVAAYLSAERGIGVRDGRFCAHPLLTRLGARRGALRASVGVGSTVQHVDRLVDAVEDYLARGARARYAVLDGGWAVVDDPRPLIPVHGLERLAATAAACGPALD